MSKPATLSTAQNELFQPRLSSILNPRHPLLTLEKSISWEALESDLNLTFSPDKAGQPPKPVRLIVGLLMLQHMEGLSDEMVVSKWVENPYWQAFCGFDHLQWRLPLDPSSLTRWRKKMGEEGLEKVLKATLQTALTMGVAKEEDFEKVIADTTVMEANIAYPTDGRLLQEAREKLVSLAKKEGLCLRQTYVRVGAALLRKVQGYAHAKQFKRMNQGLKKLKTYLGRVVRDIERKATDPQRQGSFAELLALSKRLLEQTKTSKNKVYSLHAPHVYCVAKGKARRPYEFGAKVSLVVSHKQGLALGALALERPAYDGHTLEGALEQACRISGRPVSQAFVDRGYKGHGVTKSDVYISGQRRGMTKLLRKALKRRSAIEPHIGHMKAEGKLGRNFLKGILGTKLNALLVSIGHNLRLLLAFLKSLFVLFLGWVIAQKSPFLDHKNKQKLFQVI